MNCQTKCNNLRDFQGYSAAEGERFAADRTRPPQKKSGIDKAKIYGIIIVYFAEG